jgi:pyridoxal phosphate enzyme (YggS family)
MNIRTNILATKKQITEFSLKYGKKINTVRLLAVSKGQPVEKINAALQAGQIDFGENYLQEALKKISAFPDTPIVWHFIGQIQSNKTKKIAEYFSWVQSVHDFKIATRLNKQRPSHLPPLNICLQVDLTHDQSKTGVTLAALKTLATQCLSLPNIRLRGLMFIGLEEKNFEKQRDNFSLVHQAWLQLRAQGFQLDTLSMGMSGDFEAAIAEGSTLVRIGTGIFGKRSYPLVP